MEERTRGSRTDITSFLKGHGVGHHVLMGKGELCPYVKDIAEEVIGAVSVLLEDLQTLEGIFSRTVPSWRPGAGRLNAACRASPRV